MDFSGSDLQCILVSVILSHLNTECISRHGSINVLLLWLEERRGLLETLFVAIEAPSEYFWRSQIAVIFCKSPAVRLGERFVILMHPLPGSRQLWLL